MAAFLVALSLFGLALLVHLAWWRCAPPSRHTRALLVVFGGVVLAGAGVWLAGWQAGLAPADLPGVLFFYGGAAGCYLIVYTGVEESSPSVLIIAALEQAGDAGCTESDLAGCVTDARLTAPRLAALRRDGLIVDVPGGAALTPAGRRFGRLTIALARLFHLHEGA